MIGGADLVLDGCFGPDELVRFVRRLRQLWPALVAETLSSGPASLELLAEKRLEGEMEFFFYRSAEARASWEDEGMTSDNQAELVHMVIHPDTTTLVLDSRGSELWQRVNGIAEALDREAFRRTSSLYDTDLRMGRSGPARLAP